MENKRYIQDFKHENKNIYDLMKGIACVDCGLIPNSDTKLIGPHSTTSLNVNGWQTWKEIVCPLCLRKRKIKKILNGL